MDLTPVATHVYRVPAVTPGGILVREGGLLTFKRSISTAQDGLSQVFKAVLDVPIFPVSHGMTNGVV